MTNLTAPPIGLKFHMRCDSPWSGPCPNCNRKIARKRKYRGELPCTDHHPVSGTERSVWLTEVTGHGDMGALAVSYKTLALVSMENPLPGTEGCQVNGGSMTVGYWYESVASGRVVIL